MRDAIEGFDESRKRKIWPSAARPESECFVAWKKAREASLPRLRAHPAGHVRLKQAATRPDVSGGRTTTRRTPLSVE